MEINVLIDGSNYTGRKWTRIDRELGVKKGDD